jgi:hypothetical protein
MRMKGFVLAAAVAAVLGGAPRPAIAGWWPIYHYWGYDSTFGYYGSPSDGPSYFYVPPKPVSVEAVCVARRVWVAKRWQWVCS